MIQIVYEWANLCPKILYKYRKWDENGKNFIDRQLFSARPDSLLDLTVIILTKTRSFTLPVVWIM